MRRVISNILYFSLVFPYFCLASVIVVTLLSSLKLADDFYNILFDKHLPPRYNWFEKFENFLNYLKGTK